MKREYRTGRSKMRWVHEPHRNTRRRHRHEARSWLHKEEWN